MTIWLSSAAKAMGVALALVAFLLAIEPTSAQRPILPEHWRLGVRESCRALDQITGGGPRDCWRRTTVTFLTHQECDRVIEAHDLPGDMPWEDLFCIREAIEVQN